MSEQAKIALVTGANKGIGFETARQLAAKGIVVLIGARDLEKGEAAAKTLEGEGLKARAVKIDVADRADHAAVAEWIQQEYGVLDILVNNAGVQLDGELGTNTTLDVSEEALRTTFDTNFFAVVGLTKALLPLLRKSAGGRIVNVSSILASTSLHATVGSPVYNAKTFGYNASKTALNSFTVHLAHELKDSKIKVNSAHPGWVKTDMGTAAAPMNVVDGAKTEVWLATLPADGPTGGFFHLEQALPW